MKIYLASDIHVEFFKDFSGPTEPVDIIILAGDIHVGRDAITVVEKFQERYSAPIIFVAGNHEFYESDIDQIISEFRIAATYLDNVYFLENDSVEINGVRFLGCTLWSDFTLHGEDRAYLAKAEARSYINDFSIIYQGGTRFSPNDAIKRFRESYAWLEEELAKPFGGDTVVITHFAPHRKTIHPDYLETGADQLTPYFTADCADLMQLFPIKAWFYGHTHNSVDVVIEHGTRVVSNQRGYPHEDESYTRFDARKIIEI